jgi:PAS domain S-box-containing protein
MTVFGNWTMLKLQPAVTDIFRDRIREAGAEIFFGAPIEADSREGLFRKILDELPAAIYVTDALGRITYFNEAAARLWGHRPTVGTSEWCGSWKLFWPDGRPLPPAECPMATAIKEKRAIRGIEAVAERPDGSRVPVEPYPTPIFDAAGTLIGAVNLLIDITDRKRAEEVRQRLSSIVEFCDDAIISKNLDGIIESWNAGAERIFGYTAKEAIGQSVEMLIPPERINEEADIINRIRSGERVDHYETVRRRKDGGLIDISLTVSPLMNSEGKVLGASKIARDITERHKAQEQNELLFREMDHRIRNLFAVAGSVVTLSARSADSPKELVSIIRDRLDALARAHALTIPKRLDRSVETEQSTTLQRLIRTIMSPYEEANGRARRIAIGGPDVAVSAALATSFALLLHEFATNASKYGALSTPTGHVDIVCTEADDVFSLTWTERGGPRIAREPTSQGFGSQLAQATVVDRLGGEISREWNPDGLTIRVSVARPRLAA